LTAPRKNLRILGLLCFNDWTLAPWHAGDYYYLAAALCWGIANVADTYEYIAQSSESEKGVEMKIVNGA